MAGSEPVLAGWRHPGNEYGFHRARRATGESPAGPHKNVAATYFSSPAHVSSAVWVLSGKKVARPFDLISAVLAYVNGKLVATAEPIDSLYFITIPADEEGTVTFALESAEFGVQNSEFRIPDSEFSRRALRYAGAARPAGYADLLVSIRDGLPDGLHR